MDYLSHFAPNRRRCLTCLQKKMNGRVAVLIVSLLYTIVLKATAQNSGSFLNLPAAGQSKLQGDLMIQKPADENSAETLFSLDGTSSGFGIGLTTDASGNPLVIQKLFGSNGSWQWLYLSGANTHPSMTLDTGGKLTLYSANSFNPVIVLDPSTAQVTINGRTVATNNGTGAFTALSTSTQSIGNGSVLSSGMLAAGSGAVASGSNAIALGANSRALDTQATALAGGVAAGQYSVAMGVHSSTGHFGMYSTAIGYNASASGAFALALGCNASATNYFSTAIGDQTTATGSDSVAMGVSTQAQGWDSMALGDWNYATGESALATGGGTVAHGYASTTMGYHTSLKGITCSPSGATTWPKATR